MKTIVCYLCVVISCHVLAIFNACTYSVCTSYYMAPWGVTCLLVQKPRAHKCLHEDLGQYSAEGAYSA